MFGGTWTCHDGGYLVPWRIAATPSQTWTTVSYGRGSNGGTAFVGFLPPAHQWLYEDFHADGSYARNVSQGPVSKTWTWTGSYYTARRILSGRVMWRLSTPSRIDRTFEPLQNGRYVVSGRDYCTK